MFVYALSERKTNLIWSNVFFIKNRVFVFPGLRLFACPPNLAPSFCFGPGPQFVFTGPGFEFTFTGSGPKFFFTSPGPKFVFTGPGPNLYLSTLAPNLCLPTLTEKDSFTSPGS